MVHTIPKFTVVPLIKLWIRKKEGMENIPKEGAFIIAANHSSYMDHLVVGSTMIPYLDKKVHYLAKKEHFENFIERKCYNYFGAIPVDRQSGGKSALRSAIKELRQGEIIAMYPEGTRSLTGKIQKAKTGIARLVLAAKVPVLPIGLIGAFEILPKGRHMPKAKRADINIGKPIYFGKYYKKQVTKKLLREITTIIMKEIAKLSRQKYNFD